MKIRVGVVFGGESVEHEVSVISALQGIEALDKERYEVIPLYISKQRDFYSSPALLDVENYKNLDELIQKATPVVLVKKGKEVVVEPIKKGLFTKPIGTVDVIVPIMHGTNGEDGTIQGYLEMLKIPYAGCDVIGAAVGQDKVVMKHILQNSGLPVCPWFWLYGHEFAQKQEAILAQVHELGYPVVMKPACLGSSVGITIAHNDEEFIAGVEDARQYDNKIVVEQMVKNLREINCSVLGSCFDCQASVLEEVGKQDEIMSFKDKYLGQGSTKGGSKGGVKCGTKSGDGGMASAARIVPAPVDEATTEKIRNLAIETFKVLGASGVCRIDFMMDGDTGMIYVNEINTIPGSLAYYLWQPVGVSFTQLMDRLVSQAIDRQRRREKMIFSYETNLLASYSANKNNGGTKGTKGTK